MTCPAGLATHSAEHICYVGDDGPMRRRGRTVDVPAAGPAAPYVPDHEEVDGIMVPTRRRVHPAGAVSEDPLLTPADAGGTPFA